MSNAITHRHTHRHTPRHKPTHTQKIEHSCVSFFNSAHHIIFTLKSPLAVLIYYQKFINTGVGFHFLSFLNFNYIFFALCCFYLGKKLKLSLIPLFKCKLIVSLIVKNKSVTNLSYTHTQTLQEMLLCSCSSMNYVFIIILKSSICVVFVNERSTFERTHHHVYFLI